LAPSRLTRYLALVAFTFDNNTNRDGNVYYALNKALRERKASVHPFRRWQGFLYFLMRALDKVTRFQGTVCRAGNAGLDQATVRHEYTMGRPIQWAAFSSTTKDVAAARRFVKKDVGVVFKLKRTRRRGVRILSQGERDPAEPQQAVHSGQRAVRGPGSRAWA
jgi:hypothetical protein